MHTKTALFLPLLILTLAGCRTAAPRLPGAAGAEEDLQARAYELAHKFIIVDGHVDVPYRMTEAPEDVTRATEGGDFDHPRARRGGLDAPFMSIYIPAAYQTREGAARAHADSLIDLVEGFARRAPDRFAVASSVEAVRRHARQGLVSLPMGMENGAPIETLADLRHFYDRGIRYITLTHGTDNRLSDSSYDSTHTWNGLSPFGEQVVGEMNRLGIMVDVSHLSDSAFYDVMRVTRAPVIASHSSARAFTPGWERNMDDAMIRRLAAGGGVLMINFGSYFLRTAYQAESDSVQAEIAAYLAAHNLAEDAPEAMAYTRDQRRAHPIGTVEDVADHIDHVVRLVGVDHVGLGSDFDGVFALPRGLQDVSEYPNLVRVLLERGYSEEDIGKILGGNALRVWEDVERIARQAR